MPGAQAAFPGGSHPSKGWRVRNVSDGCFPLFFFPWCSNEACVTLALGSPPPCKALSSAVLGRGPDSPAPPSLLRRDGNSPFDWAQPAQRDVLFFFSLFLMPCRAFLDLGWLFCKVFGPGFP